jgi:cobalt-zinc-cadmium efflux system outer membrane protein
MNGCTVVVQARPGHWLLCRRIIVYLCALFSLSSSTAKGRAEPLPENLTREAAVRWALENNPELATLRQQHGIAAAAVVIAETYPFNPIWEAKVRAASGPESAGITNRVSNEHKLLLDVEVRGQRGHRRRAAGAGLERTDWEIAFQEVSLAARVLRAFDTALYYQDKLRLGEETLHLNEKAAEDVRRLVEQGRLRPTDLLVARTEVNDTRAQLGPTRVAYEKAWNELRRGLGVAEGSFSIQGSLHDLGYLATPDNTQALLATAFERRPDLHARQAAVQEADARARLAVADRYGNPNVGPAYEYDPTRINLIGVQFSVPLPVLNTHRGEIYQREAERVRAALDLRQLEITIQQDLIAALARLTAARGWADTYRSQVLPELQKSLDALQQLFTVGEPSADLLRILDVRRKLLKAREGYLDALWEVVQAKVDVAAAIGDPTLALVGKEASSIPEQSGWRK